MTFEDAGDVLGMVEAPLLVPDGFKVVAASPTEEQPDPTNSLHSAISLASVAPGPLLWRLVSKEGFGRVLVAACDLPAAISPHFTHHQPRLHAEASCTSSIGGDARLLRAPSGGGTRGGGKQPRRAAWRGTGGGGGAPGEPSRGGCPALLSGARRGLGRSRRL